MSVYAQSCKSDAEVVLGDYLASSNWVFVSLDLVDSGNPSEKYSGNGIEKWGLLGLGAHVYLTNEASEYMQYVFSITSDIVEVAGLLSNFLGPEASVIVDIVCTVIGFWLNMYVDILNHFTNERGVWFNIHPMAGYMILGAGGR